MSDVDPLLAVLAYHERTKHQPGRFARALGYMDWATQPDPFRRYLGAELLPLDLVPPVQGPAWDAVLRGDVAPAPVSRQAVSQLFFDSLALSAWKVAGRARWSLRVNPSSGNLHPTEGYLIAGPIAGLRDAPAVYHYAPHEHALEVRRELTDLALPEGALLVGLTSIYWRESWKYGERAFRYCQHDVGHAIAGVALAAAALGWEARMCDGISDAALATLLGIHEQRGEEAEHPDCLLLLQPRGAQDHAFQIPDALVAKAPALGTPNALSRDHHAWPIIEAVSEATVRGAVPAAERHVAAMPPLDVRPAIPARRLFHQRRSAVEMDGSTSITADVFHGMLRRVVGTTPLAALPWRPAIDLMLFVHRVTGVDPGLYLLVRDPARLSRLRAACRPELAWSRPASCPDGLDLLLLVPGDVRDAAKIASCGQDIAADGAFAVGMLADFEEPLRARGPWMYRRLHWEAGAIGQVLYLEAHAAGISATGIGCFLDDVLHTILGLSGEAHQNLYNFTIGGPVEDTRIQTEPPYAHLVR